MALSNEIAKCLGCGQEFTTVYPSATRIGNYPDVKGFLHHGCTDPGKMPTGLMCCEYRMLKTTERNTYKCTVCGCRMTVCG